MAGGDIVARFTVDTRAELGVWAAGSVYVDTNGNFGFDPENKDNDNTNEDITYVLGFTSDNVFAGNFDGNAANGDEVGLKDGNNWHLDAEHDFNVETILVGDLIGCPIVGDFDGDGVDDIGLWAPDRNGAVPQETAEWYIFISAGTPIPNRIVANPQAIGGNIVDFTPAPFGNDIYAQFGDDFALPVVGNFDPPVIGENPPQLEFATFTNPNNPIDVNGDGFVTPVDVLHIFNVINRGEGGLITVFRSEAEETGPYYDTSGDGHITPLDALMVINRLNAIASGEGESTDALAPFVSSSTGGISGNAADVTRLPSLPFPPEALRLLLHRAFDELTIMAHWTRRHAQHFPRSIP